MKITSQSYPDTAAQPVKFIVSGIGAQKLELHPIKNEDGSVQLNYEFADLPDGSYSVSAVAVGHHRSSAASELVNLTVRNTAPDVPILTIEAPPVPEPPAITALNPVTGAAGADITVNITGTGFDAGATVNVGVAHSLVPTSSAPTALSVLFSGASHIQYPGVLPVSVTNADGQVSNALDFTVT
jgi:IPT/TIG domain